MTLIFNLILISVVAFLFYKSRKAELLMFLICSLIVSNTLLYISENSGTSDVNVISGVITNKEFRDISCRHSYSCNCRTECSSSGKESSCTTVCDTCYEHSFDRQWVLNTNALYYSYYLDGEDRQGLVPSRVWLSKKKGDPVATTIGYTNYIKAHPNNVLHTITAQKKWVPDYPDSVRDKFYIDRFITAGDVGPVDKQIWNKQLQELNSKIGPTRQMNVIIVMVHSDRAYKDALTHAWLGGKKNDLIVMLGVSSYPKIDWVDVVSWSKSEDVKQTIISQVETMQASDTSGIIGVIENNAISFKRSHTQDYEYLNAEAEPSAWVLLFLATVNGLGLWFVLQKPESSIY